jgi:hypothetical protein
MFSLSEEDLHRKLLDCAAGPASFQAEARTRGCDVVSCDPLYGFPVDAVRQRIDAAFPDVVELSRQNQDLFRWDRIGSVDELARIRRQAMDLFLADYRSAPAGRYVDGALPYLPFAGRRFDLALCSHFLFLYSDQFDAQFHTEAIVELARVANEVRVFPLLDMAAQRSPHLDAVLAGLDYREHETAILTVDYEFQRGGNEMLWVAAR